MHDWIWVWLLFAAIMGIAEVFTRRLLYLPFALGGLAAAGLDFAGVDVTWQWVAWATLSFGGLIVFGRLFPDLGHDEEDQR